MPKFRIFENLLFYLDGLLRRQENSETFLLQKERSWIGGGEFIGDIRHYKRKKQAIQTQHIKENFFLIGLLTATPMLATITFGSSFCLENPRAVLAPVFTTTVQNQTGGITGFREHYLVPALKDENVSGRKRHNYLEIRHVPQ